VATDEKDMKICNVLPPPLLTLCFWLLRKCTNGIWTKIGQKCYCFISQILPI